MGEWSDPASGQRRALWALIVTLSYSREIFIYPSFDQTLQTVVTGLDEAWKHFGGVPARVVIDNLKPAVLKADPLSPTIHSGFLEYSHPRGFFVDAARVRRPKDKPRVESQVRYARQAWFQGETFSGIHQMRQDAARWCVDVAGQRVHGTTRRKPRDLFLQEEQLHLQPALEALFRVPLWTDAKVHPDHHIQGVKAAQDGLTFIRL